MARKEHWKPKPEEQDFPAARDYLSLLVPDAVARQLVGKLRRASLVHRKAKDLLRASELPLLPANNVHVASDLKKARKGRKLSPTLLVRGDVRSGRPLLLADGYHRICASYYLDEDADIPCRIVDLTPAPRRS